MRAGRTGPRKLPAGRIRRSAATATTRPTTASSTLTTPSSANEVRTTASPTPSANDALRGAGRGASVESSVGVEPSKSWRSRSTAGITSGRISANAQRQPSVLATRPPYAGPSRPGTAHATAHAANILGRRRAGKRRVMIASRRAYCAPPPAPWTRRPTTNTGMSGAASTITLPSTKTAVLT